MMNDFLKTTVHRNFIKFNKTKSSYSRKFYESFAKQILISTSTNVIISLPIFVFKKHFLHFITIHFFRLNQIFAVNLGAKNRMNQL